MQLLSTIDLERWTMVVCFGGRQRGSVVLIHWAAKWGSAVGEQDDAAPDATDVLPNDSVQECCTL